MGEVVAHLVGNEDAVDDDVEFGAGSQKLFHLRMVQNVLKILKGVKVSHLQKVSEVRFS